MHCSRGNTNYKEWNACFPVVVVVLVGCEVHTWHIIPTMYISLCGVVEFACAELGKVMRVLDFVWEKL